MLWLNATDRNFAIGRLEAGSPCQSLMDTSKSITAPYLDNGINIFSSIRPQVVPKVKGQERPLLLRTDESGCFALGQAPYVILFDWISSGNGSMCPGAAEVVHSEWNNGRTQTFLAISQTSQRSIHNNQITWPVLCDTPSKHNYLQTIDVDAVA